MNLPALPLKNTSVIVEKWLSCAQQFFSHNRYEDFLYRWAVALTAYGTLPEFMQGLSFSEEVIEIVGVPTRVVMSHGGEAHERVNLMQKQGNYTPLRPASAYPTALSSSCPLCGNIAQQQDALFLKDPSLEVALYDLEEWLVLPNKYPTVPGASLFISKNHDNEEKKICPIPTHDKKWRFRKEEGKTFGRIIPINELLSLFQLCDELDLLATRNHPRDAMSIPQHDHTHLIPAEIPWFEKKEMITSRHSLNKTSKGVCWKEVSEVPFALLMLHSENKELLAEETHALLHRLEAADQIYCLGYYQGSILISPRRTEGLGEGRVIVGARSMFLAFCSSDISSGLLDMERVYGRGEYSWESFLA